jgi:hypothetical protein
MVLRRTLKAVHFVSTVWFLLCVFYIAVTALRQAGFRWWVIFSLSGHSAVVVFLLVSLYLFAIFRQIERSGKQQNEHPLTSSGYYSILYNIGPFLGAVAGAIGMVGVRTISEFVAGVSLGTLGTTFLLWIIVDPAVGYIEGFLPASRKSRQERLARLQEQRETREREKKELLEDVFSTEQSDRQKWENKLMPWARELAEFLTDAEKSITDVAERAAVIGTGAWQMGGLSCMKQLYMMTEQVCRDKSGKGDFCEYLSNWWDGIGSWRSPSFV